MSPLVPATFGSAGVSEGDGSFTIPSALQVQDSNGVYQDVVNMYAWVPAGGGGGGGGDPLFYGHQPGKTYIGFSSQNSFPNGVQADIDQAGGQWGGYRFYDAFNSAKIDFSHARGAIPFLSIKSADLGVSGAPPACWNAVASGAGDTAIRAGARLIAAKHYPVSVTFHHEPQGDAGGDVDGPAWAAAQMRVWSIIEDETGGKNMIKMPILGGQPFIAAGKDQTKWATPALLAACHALAVDDYQTPDKVKSRLNYRLGAVRNFLTTSGFPDLPMAVGETSGTNVFRLGGTYQSGTIPADSAAMTGAQFVDDALSYITDPANNIWAVIIFNSTAASKAGTYWPLDEDPVLTGAGKLDTVDGTAGTATVNKIDVWRRYTTGARMATLAAVTPS